MPMVEGTAPPRIQEYPVPAGSSPHDVAPAPDGTVWYTAQAAGKLGRLQPADGTVREVMLGEGSAPHGVIIGPDLTWRGDHWQANPTASADSQVRRAPEPDFDVLVRNVYKVLLTRGLIGCIIFSTDPETRALLTKLGVPPA